MQTMGCPLILNKNAQNPAMIFVDRDGPAMLQLIIKYFCKNISYFLCPYTSGGMSL